MMSTSKGSVVGRSPSDCNTMKVMMKEVMHAEQVPVILAVVRDEVQKGVTNIASNVKEQVDNKTKLWTDLFNKKTANDKEMLLVDSVLSSETTVGTNQAEINYINNRITIKYYQQS